MTVDTIDFGTALFIKLGRGGEWEQECIARGTLRFGYKETPFAAAMSEDWEQVRSVWAVKRKDAGAASRDLIQIKHFFTSPANTLWITFYQRRLYWCFSEALLREHPDGGSLRRTREGWRSTDSKGHELSTDKLSGALLRVQGFQGTICEVKGTTCEYLKRKINGDVLPKVKAAQSAYEEMAENLLPVVQELTWQDFEILVDLVFARSGWRRVGSLGGTQKTADIELLLPTTGERAFVQIKASTNKAEFQDYVKSVSDSERQERMFFVWHSGGVGIIEQGKLDSRITLVNPEKLAKMILDAGLASWVLDKAS